MCEKKKKIKKEKRNLETLQVHISEFWMAGMIFFRFSMLFVLIG